MTTLGTTSMQLVMRMPRIFSFLLITGLAFSACTPVSHKPSRFKVGDPYTPDPKEPRHEKYE